MKFYSMKFREHTHTHTHTIYCAAKEKQYVKIVHQKVARASHATCHRCDLLYRDKIHSQSIRKNSQSRAKRALKHFWNSAYSHKLCLVVADGHSLFIRLLNRDENLETEIVVLGVRPPLSLSFPFSFCLSRN